MGYGAEGIEAIERLQAEHNIADVRVAERVFAKLNPPPPPLLTPGYGSRSFPPPVAEQIDMAPLFAGDDETFLQSAVEAALREARGG
jgi:hypothetical protein